MPRSPLRPQTKSAHQIGADSTEQIWPDETIVLLPETPRVRLSPRRKMNPLQNTTPGWPPANIVGNTIRMYHDPEDGDEDHDSPPLDFTMNRDFIESLPPPPCQGFCVWVLG